MVGGRTKAWVRKFTFLKQWRTSLNTKVETKDLVSTTSDTSGFAAEAEWTFQCFSQVPSPTMYWLQDSMNIAIFYSLSSHIRHHNLTCFKNWNCIIKMPLKIWKKWPNVAQEFFQSCSGKTCRSTQVSGQELFSRRRIVIQLVVKITQKV